MKSLAERRIAVIGRGIAGLALALRLRQRGASPTLFGRLEGSASRCAQGLVANKGLVFFESPLFAAKLRSLAHIQTWLGEVETLSGLVIDKNFAGINEPYASSDDYQDLIVRIYRRHFLGGHRTKNRHAAAIKRWPMMREDPAGYLHYPSDGWFDVATCLRALELILERSGAAFISGDVTGILIEPSGRLQVLCGPRRDHAYSFDQVILATGAGTPSLLRSLDLEPPKNFLIGGQTVELETPFAAEAPLTFVKKTLSATWCRQKLILGSTSWKGGEASENDLLNDRRQLFEKASQGFYFDPADLASWPQEARIGTRLRFGDRMPAVGSWPFAPWQNKLFLMSGFYKNGVQLADLCALDLVSHLEGGAMHYPAFEPRRLFKGQKL